MKKFGIILLAIFSFAITNANNSEKTENNENQSPLVLNNNTEYKTITIATPVPKGLKNAITKELFYPSKAKTTNTEGLVYMRVTVDNNSNVKIVEMNATSPILGEYVKQQLASTYVKKPGCAPGDVYMMKINFNITD